MISRWAALIAGAVIGVTLVALVVIELDRRNASPIEIVVAERSNLIQAEIAGAVVSPGVYDLRRGDRVIDLIDKADGLLPTADPGAGRRGRVGLCAVGRRPAGLFQPFGI